MFTNLQELTSSLRILLCLCVCDGGCFVFSAQGKKGEAKDALNSAQNTEPSNKRPHRLSPSPGRNSFPTSVVNQLKCSLLGSTPLHKRVPSLVDSYTFNEVLSYSELKSLSSHFSLPILIPSFGKTQNKSPAPSISSFYEYLRAILMSLLFFPPPS